MRSFTVPLASAVVGGVVTAAVLLAAGGVGVRTRTVVQPAPLAASVTPMRATLTAGEIYSRNAPGVVFVQARFIQHAQTPFDLFPRAEQNISTGSGFVIDEEGTLLTNAHVVSGATDIRITFADGGTAPVNLVGRDPATDLAVLRVDPLNHDLQPLALGDSGSLKVGDPTVAIGNPFGLDHTLTTGIVSALQRRIQAPGGFTVEDVIQTDAALNPGNSGGPLLDATGSVIGVNSQIVTGGGGSEGSVGIGFAVPVDTVKDVLARVQAAERDGAPTMDG